MRKLWGRKKLRKTFLVLLKLIARAMRSVRMYEPTVLDYLAVTEGLLTRVSTKATCPAPSQLIVWSTVQLAGGSFGKALARICLNPGLPYGSVLSSPSLPTRKRKSARKQASWAELLCTGLYNTGHCRIWRWTDDWMQPHQSFFTILQSRRH